MIKGHQTVCKIANNFPLRFLFICQVALLLIPVGPIRAQRVQATAIFSSNFFPTFMLCIQLMMQTFATSQWTYEGTMVYLSNSLETVA